MKIKLLLLITSSLGLFGVVKNINKESTPVVSISTSGRTVGKWEVFDEFEQTEEESSFEWGSIIWNENDGDLND